ncbi:unnamed protein product, partial [Porites lobata]
MFLANVSKTFLSQSAGKMSGRKRPAPAQRGIMDFFDAKKSSNDEDNDENNDENQTSEESTSTEGGTMIEENPWPIEVLVEIFKWFSIEERLKQLAPV